MDDMDDGTSESEEDVVGLGGVVSMRKFSSSSLLVKTNAKITSQPPLSIVDSPFDGKFDSRPVSGLNSPALSLVGTPVRIGGDNLSILDQQCFGKSPRHKQIHIAGPLSLVCIKIYIWCISLLKI